MPSVVITRDAERDLQDIFEFIATHDSLARAVAALTQIERVVESVESLGKQSMRGAVVPELAALGMQHYRQLIARPYRVIYHKRDAHVFVVLIADARRDMQTLLQQRLLR